MAKGKGKGKAGPGRPVGRKDAKPRRKTGRAIAGLGALAPEERRIVRQIQGISIKQVAELGSMVITGDMEQLEEVARDRRGSSVLQVWYANIALTGIENGDAYALNAMLDRIIGRAKEHIEISTPDGNPITMALLSMSPEERLSQIETLRAQRKLAELD